MQVDIRPNWLIIPAIALVTLLISKHFISGNLLWFSTLHLPIITPPSWFITRMWLIIYTLTTGCALLVYNTFIRDAWFWVINVLFLSNAFLNMYWTYLFFDKHHMGTSIGCAFLLATSVWLLMYLMWNRSRLCSLLLLPYGVWMLFECVLCIWIWGIN